MRRRAYERKEALADDIKMFLGVPPFNNPTNIKFRDRYFARHLERVYNAPLHDLAKEAGYDRADLRFR